MALKSEVLTSYYKTRNTGTRNTRGTTEQRWNTGTWNNGTSEHHGTKAKYRNNGGRHYLHYLLFDYLQFLLERKVIRATNS